MRSKRPINKISTLTAVMALALLGALGNTLPAHAAPAADAPGLPDQTVMAAPGVSAQKPNAAKRPTGPRSVADQ